MVFYLDLIFLLNFFIDYLILIAVGRLLHREIKPLRIAIAATIGAVYTLTFFLPELSVFYFFISKLLLSILMVAVAFSYLHLLKFVQSLGAFYFVSFLTGGGVIAIQYLFNIKHDVINGIYVSRSSSPMLVIMIIIISFFGILVFTNGTIKTLRRKSNIQEKILDVEVFINEDSYKCKGLIDTGNQLYDPISRKPVMIIEANQLTFIPEIFKQAYQNGQFQLELFNKITEHIEQSWLTKISLVPFRSVSRDMQFILTLRPDKVVIFTEDGKEISTTKVLIGLDYGKLSNDQAYHAIIHPELLAG